MLSSLPISSFPGYIFNTSILHESLSDIYIWGIQPKSGTNIWEPLNEYKATYWGFMEDKDALLLALVPFLPI